jgi:hypothetical protein
MPREIPSVLGNTTVQSKFLFLWKRALSESHAHEMTNFEAGFLQAFDAARKWIHEAAEKVYVSGRQGS